MNFGKRTSSVGALIIATAILAGCEDDVSTSVDNASCSGNCVAASTLQFNGIDSVSEVTYRSAKLHWSSPVDAEALVLFDWTDGTAKYVATLPVSETEYVLNGLTSETTYSYQINLIDDEIKIDSNTKIETFTTPPSPPTIESAAARKASILAGSQTSTA